MTAPQGVQKINGPAIPRGRLLTGLAVLIGIMAFSNLWKPIAQTMSPESPAAFVFFGHRLHGVANAIIGPLFGCLLAAYVYGVWRMQRWVLPIAFAYAAYVPVNLALFAMNPPGFSDGVVFGVIYAIVAVGVTSGGAWYLHTHRERLR